MEKEKFNGKGILLALTILIAGVFALTFLFRNDTGESALPRTDSPYESTQTIRIDAKDVYCQNNPGKCKGYDK